MKKKKSNIIYTVIFIVVFLTLIVVATYAYYVSDEVFDGEGIEAGAKTSGLYPTFIATMGESISIDFSDLDLGVYVEDGGSLTNAESTISISMASPKEGMDYTCTYDIAWVWDSEDRYTKQSGALGDYNWYNEMLYYGTNDVCGNALNGNRIYYATSDPDTGEHIGVYDNNGNFVSGYHDANCYENAKYEYFREFAISLYSKGERVSPYYTFTKLNSEGDYVYIVENESIISRGTDPNVREYDVYFDIFNLPVDQTEFLSKNYEGHLEVVNIDCALTDIKLAPYLKNKNLASSLVDMEGDYYETENDREWYVIEENGYRIMGNNPDNYVCFDDSCSDGMYRIIGAFTDFSTTPLVKVISHENHDFGPYTTWNTVANPTSGFYNDWSVATSNTYLNTEFYDGLSDNAKSMIVDATWYLGGLDSVDYTADQFYAAERNPDSVYSDGTYSNPSTSTGKVGLIYASDWGYAVSAEDCARTSTLVNYDALDSSGQSCIWANWLANEGWTYSGITPSTADSTGIYYILWGYSIAFESARYNGGYTRPTMYLNENVGVKSGYGTFDKPYILYLMDE